MTCRNDLDEFASEHQIMRVNSVVVAQCTRSFVARGSENRKMTSSAHHLSSRLSEQHSSRDILDSIPGSRALLTSQRKPCFADLPFN